MNSSWIQESAADASIRFSWDRLWKLFDGSEASLNIAHECLDRHDPDAAAVRLQDGEGRLLEFTFGDLAARTSRFAHWLVDHDVEANTPVGVMMEPSLEFYTALFGIIKRGAVAVPLYTLFGPDAVRDRVNDCGLDMVVTDRERASVVDAIGVKPSVFDDELWKQLDDLPSSFASTTSARDRAVLQYTSGTTRGLPEAVTHDHRSVVTLARAGLYALGLAEGDRYFCPSSPAWGHGLWHGTIAPWSFGIALGTCAGRFDVNRLIDAVTSFSITNLAAASTVYRMVVASGRADELSLTKASYTGEELDATAQIAFREQTGVPVCGMYGTTETGVVLVNFPGFADHEPRIEALGRPMPGCRLAVLDDDDRQVEPGVKGELAVWRRGRWFRSKDLAWTDEDGFFYYGGRADDVIISAGWTISPLEVERALLKHEAVAEAAVIGVPDQTRGRALKAFVIARGIEMNERAALAEDLQALVKQDLSPHEYPRHIEFVETLPELPNGKVNRRALNSGDTNTGPAGPSPESGAS